MTVDRALPLVQLMAGITAAIAVFLSPLPVWAALLIVAVAAGAVAVWLERMAPEPAPAAAGERLVRVPAGKVVSLRERTVLDDDEEGAA